MSRFGLQFKSTHNVVRPPGSVTRLSLRVGTKTANKNVEIKVAFTPYDMVPGKHGRVFIRNLLTQGGKADETGYSLIDCMLRVDEGAVAPGQPPVQVAGAAPLVLQPGAPPLPAQGVGNAQQQTRADKKHDARLARVKNSGMFILQHISDEGTLQILGDPGNTLLFQNGPEIYEYVRSVAIVSITPAELMEMTAEWITLSIVKDVGITENTIKDTLKLLKLRNAERPTASQFSNDVIAEKILEMVKNASAHLHTYAVDELNAVEGVPGQPGVRRHQLAVAAAVGGVVPPRLRDLQGLVVRDGRGSTFGANARDRPGTGVGRVRRVQTSLRVWWTLHTTTPSLDFSASARADARGGGAKVPRRGLRRADLRSYGPHAIWPSS